MKRVREITTKSDQGWDFDAPPQAPERDHNYQKECAVDYRLAYMAMGTGQQETRDFLSEKYRRPLDNLAQLWALGQELFGRMDAEEQAYDLYDAERKLQDALDTAEEGMDHI